MLTRLQVLVRGSRARRARDEQGSAMLLVVVIVLIGFLISAGISAASLASVKQTTNSRSQVQALAAAEAGRDTVAGYLKKPVPSCDVADMSGSIPGAGSWSVKMYYKIGANLVPDGYDAAGVPQGGGWSGSALCVDMAAADFDPGLYSVVLASTGTAPDGTKRLITSVYPFRVERPGDSIVAPNIGPFTLKGALGGTFDNPAHEGDLVVKGDFTCAKGGTEITFIDGDLYVLDGNARFGYPGCYVTGDVYVSGNATVDGEGAAGPATTQGIGRILSVGGTLKVGGNLDENHGMTVKKGITVGGDVTLRCGNDNSEGVNVGADLPAGSLALWAGGTITLAKGRPLLNCGPNADLINGNVRAVQGFGMGDTERGALDSSWKISGSLDANTTVDLKGANVTGRVRSGGPVVMDRSSTGPIVAVGAVTATGDGTVTGNVTSRSGNITLSTNVTQDVRGNGTIQVNNAATVTGNVSTTSTSTSPAAVTLLQGAKVNGTVTTPGAASATGDTGFLGLGDVPAMLGKAGVTTGADVTLNFADAGPISTRGKVTKTGKRTTISGDIVSSSTATTAVDLTDVAVTGGIWANRAVALSKVVVGTAAEPRSVSAGGNVSMVGSEVSGSVVTNGDFEGASDGAAVVGVPGLTIGGTVRAAGNVTVTETVAAPESIGNDTNPAIWAGGTVRLLRATEDSTVVYPDVATVKGEVRARNANGANVSVTIQRRWEITQRVWRASGGHVIEDCARAAELCVAGYRSPKINGEQNGLTVFGSPESQSQISSSITAPTGIPATPVTTELANQITTTLNGVTPVTAPTAENLPFVVAPSAAQLSTLADGVTVLDAGHWMDLSYTAVRDAALSDGYQTTFEGQPLTFSGADCTDGGLLGLGWSKAAQALGKVIKAGSSTGPAPKYLVDTTACTEPLNAKFAVALEINSDVVVLVKNFKNQLTSTIFGGTSGTAASPRNLFFIQPDSTPDNLPTCNNSTDAAPSNRNKNKRLDEQTDRVGFDFDSAYGDERVSTMYYTPCGFGGVITPSAASSRFYGQLFLGRQSSGIWNEFHCQPMQLGNPRALDLTCGEPMTASDVAGSGGSKVYTLESDTPLHQTEPSS